MSVSVRNVSSLLITAVATMMATLACVALAVPGTARGAAQEPVRPVVAPRGDTIVRVLGDAANGFAIHHLDGSVLYPPTGSEARAECGEYADRVQRVRCQTEVAVWYRDLAQLKRALRYAHSR